MVQPPNVDVVCGAFHSVIWVFEVQNWYLISSTATLLYDPFVVVTIHEQLYGPRAAGSKSGGNFFPGSTVADVMVSVDEVMRVSASFDTHLVLGCGVVTVS